MCVVRGPLPSRRVVSYLGRCGEWAGGQYMSGGCLYLG